MICLIALVAMFVAVESATTVTMPPTSMMPDTTTTMMPAKILYDDKHHKAMIVRADGCYEYHMNRQDTIDSQNDATRATLEARMLQELSMAINIQESGHHHIDHMTAEIQAACAALPVYSWEVPAP